MPAHLSDFRPSFWQEMCRHLYSLVLLLLVPVAFLNLLVRGYTRQIEYAQRKRERFGILPQNLKAGGYLFHCVSVGEVVVASMVIKRILEESPDQLITITTTTPTGSQRVQNTFGNKVQHFYLPYDLPFPMRHLLKKLKPTKVCVTEVELWPNLIHFCWRLNIPSIVINARMTERSARRYQKFSALFYPMLQKLTSVCAQGQRDFDNYLALGVDSTKLQLTQNIKFELNVNDELHANVTRFKESFGIVGRPVWIAASTHEPEESVILDAHVRLLKHFPDLLLIIVPRHPQRFESVKALISEQKLVCLTTSENKPLLPQTQVLLMDEMGKLSVAYGVANFAFVGGSIVDKGGHNALEAAVFSIPSMMGPHTYNNPEICQLLESAGGLVSTASADEIYQQAYQWLSDPEKLKINGGNAKRVIEENAGALERTLNQILT